MYSMAKGIGPVLPPRRRIHHPATISFRYVSVPRLLALVAVFFESQVCSRRLRSCSRFFDWFPSRRSLLGHSSSFESSEALVAAVRILALVTEEMRDHTPGPLDMRLLSIAPRVFSWVQQFTSLTLVNNQICCWLFASILLLFFFPL